MFVDAIESAAKFTRPIHTIQRFYGSQEVFPGAATLFFVNPDGWAVTCRHVAQAFIAADQLSERKRAFEAEFAKLPTGKKRQQEKDLERKHRLKKGELYELKNRFIGCAIGDLDIKFLMHTAADLALVKFSGFSSLEVNEFPVFPADGSEIKQGRSLCRLGFPFPEFTNFAYNAQSDSIDWVEDGRANSPRFPIEGMVTRHLAGPNGAVGIEVSTPGLRGQSGGPAFDVEGTVWGMQSATAHLDLDFDVDMEVVRQGRKTHKTDSAFLHVGHCVHADVIKAFMREHGVDFAMRGA